jgi:hypothetical protein
VRHPGRHQNDGARLALSCQSRWWRVEGADPVLRIDYRRGRFEAAGDFRWLSAPTAGVDPRPPRTYSTSPPRSMPAATIATYHPTEGPQVCNAPVPFSDPKKVD